MAKEAESYETSGQDQEFTVCKVAETNSIEAFKWNWKIFKVEKKLLKD